MSPSQSASYVVRGMTCAHCVAAVTEEVRALPGVLDVRVDLATGALDVVADPPPPYPAVVEAVREAGYELT